MNDEKHQTQLCNSTLQTAETLKAIGHPVRLQILRELCDLESCCCAEMCKCFPHSQSTISQHLSILKEAGLVDFEKNGNKSCYSLNHEALKKLQTSLNALFPQEGIPKHD